MSISTFVDKHIALAIAERRYGHLGAVSLPQSFIPVSEMHRVPEEHAIVN
jgi:hypothetical protein